MNGDLTIAFAESIGTLWDGEEPSSDPDNMMDYRAVNYFIYK